MKKLIAVLLTGVLLLSLCGAWAEEPATDRLTVAVTTPMTGNFFTARWGNNTSDTDVRALIHGCNLVYWDNAGGLFAHDPTVVSSLMATAEREGGDRTYTVVLRSGLCWSDGTPITAWDYAFSFLLSLSPELDALGANGEKPLWIVGADAYNNGTAKALAGVRVLSDNQLSVTMKGKYFPFFYELGLLSCEPCPISVIAPGAKVADDGMGVYLQNPESFTEEGLRATLLDGATGYCAHPSLSCGPYVLTSYADGVAEFDLNPYYPGDPQGRKPSIAHITFKNLSQDQLIPALERGEVDLVNKVTQAEAIDAGLALTEANPAYASAQYLRSGMAFISFNTERGILADNAVRQAITLATDRDALAAATTGSHGLRADGYYGQGQWMVQLLNGTLENPALQPKEGATPEEEAAQAEAAAKWGELQLSSIEAYTPDAGEAAQLLEEAGWSLNGDGQPFTPGTDTLRYRQGESGLEPLRLSLAYPQGSAAGPALEELLPANLAAVGAELSVEAIPMADLLPQYYHTRDRDYDMFFLASNFSLLYDPSMSFVQGEDGTPVWAAAALADRSLYDAAVAMRKTQPGDLLGYCSAWLGFQERFMQVLPAMPIYSNTYYDFYTARLQDYPVSTSISWPQALAGATLNPGE